MSDILFKSDNMNFSFRVGAVIIHNSNVLMVKNENYPYYYPVGGGVQFGETSEEAVLREVWEETGVNLEIDRLIFIHENIFSATFVNDLPFYELRLFYLMKTNDDIENIVCNSSGLDGGRETLHWLPVDKLSEYPAFPEFYKSELYDLPNKVKHFITKNDITVLAN